MLISLILAVEVQAQQTPANPVTHPTTTVEVSHPVTTAVVSKPTTFAPVSHSVTPATSVARPVTQTPVTKPVTVVPVVQPQTTAVMSRPVTTAVVTHPVTEPMPFQGEKSVEKKQVSSVSKEGNSRAAKTSMSDFKSMKAKDLKAAGTSNVTGGLSSTPETASQNSTMDKMRQTSFVSSDPMANAPKVGNVNTSGMAKVISQKAANVNKK